MQEKIRNNARDSMNKAQKEFYLREQLRAIKKELGEDDLEEIDWMEQLEGAPHLAVVNYYDLEKIISITSIYHIYNNSNENIIITCFLLKKPFWFK